MKNKLGLVIALIFLAYGLIRIFVGGALLAQMHGMVNSPGLAEAVSATKHFIGARESRQLIQFSVPVYFAYIMAMGAMLSAGAIGAIAYKRWGHVLIGIYLAMHTALFVDFQEMNPKLVVLIVTIIMLVALVYLRPAKPPSVIH